MCCFAHLFNLLGKDWAHVASENAAEMRNERNGCVPFLVETFKKVDQWVSSLKSSYLIENFCATRWKSRVDYIASALKRNEHEKQQLAITAQNDEQRIGKASALVRRDHASVEHQHRQSSSKSSDIVDGCSCGGSSVGNHVEAPKQKSRREKNGSRPNDARVLGARACFWPQHSVDSCGILF
jgi:hypothetical protein